MLQEDFHDAGNCKELGDVAVDQYQIEAIVAVGLLDQLELAVEVAQHRLIGFDREDTSFRAVGKTGFKIARNSFWFLSAGDPAQLAALRAGIAMAGSRPGLRPRIASWCPSSPTRSASAWRFGSQSRGFAGHEAGTPPIRSFRASRR